MVRFWPTGWLVLSLAACSEDPEPPPTLDIEQTQALCSDGQRCLNRNTLTRELQGVRLIHKHVPGGPISAVRVMLDGGALRWTAQSAHAEGLLIQLVNWWGSQQRAISWDHELARLGAKVWANSGGDYAALSLVVPAPHFREAFGLLAAAVHDPPIDITSSAFERSKLSYLGNYETEADDPATAAALASWSLLAQEHPYTLLRRSLDQAARLLPKDLQLVHHELTQVTPMTVVVVGDAEADEVATMVEEAFASPARRRTLSAPGLPALWPSMQRVKFVRAAGAPTWYISGTFAAPGPASEQAAALRVGLSVLESRLHDELRTARGLVYSVAAGFSSLRVNYGWLQLSTDKPAEAMSVARSELEGLLRDGVTDAELDAARAQVVTKFYLSTQDAATQSLVLGDWQLISGDRELVDDQLALVGRVTAGDARDAVAAYVRNLRYGVAGPDDSLSEDAVAGERDPCDLDPYACGCPLEKRSLSDLWCNQLDDDCDGKVDEDTPRETCNGIDDDCDDKIDEAEGGKCVCSQPEICDDKDNDCDGKVDEGYKALCDVCPAEYTPQTCPGHTLFVTSITFPANFGSLEAADTRCQELATKANRPGTWRAILRDAQHDFADRIVVTRPVYNTLGQPLESDPEAFFKGSLAFFADTSELGSAPQDTIVWLGSASVHCDNWTNTSSSARGWQGRINPFVNQEWFGGNAGPCILQRSLYCIDQGL